MTLTYYEKTQFSQQITPFLERFLVETGEYSVLLFKVLALSMKNNKALLEQWDESVFLDHEKFRECFDLLLKHAVTVAAAAEDSGPTRPSSLKTYTSGDLARFFGVSQTTITNWHKENRFEGIPYTPGKQLRVSEGTLFRISSGGTVPISTVVEMWHKENEPSNGDSDLSMYTRQIALYECKYKGEFSQTLGRKLQEQWTPEEETDAEAWQYFLKRLSDVLRDQKE